MRLQEQLFHRTLQLPQMGNRVRRFLQMHIMHQRFQRLGANDWYIEYNRTEGKSMFSELG